MVFEPILLKEVKYNLFNIEFDVEFSDNIILIIGDSGTGRTFFVDMMSELCVKYPFIEILNYKDMNKDIKDIGVKTINKFAPIPIVP